MLVTIHPVGGTGDGDPRRAELPTYVLVKENDDGTWDVRIPDEDVPPDARGSQKIDAPKATHAWIVSWQDHLDDRYREHVGEYLKGAAARVRPGSAAGKKG